MDKRRTEKSRVRSGLAICLLFMTFYTLPPLDNCLGIQSPATLSPGDAAENDSGKALQETLHRNVEISLRDSGNARQTLIATTDIGEIRCGRSYLLNIQLFNDSDLELTFDDIATGCACRELKIKTGSIRPGQAVKATLSFKAPISNRLPKYKSSVRLVNDGKTAAKLIFEANLKENLHIQASNLFLDATDEGFPVQQIPFAYTSPLKNFKCIIEEDSELARVVSASVGTTGSGEGVIKIQPSDDFFMVRSFVSGEIILVETDTKIRRSLLIQLRQRPAIEILPKILFFSEDDNGGFSATAIVRCDETYSIKDVKLKLSGIDARLEEVVAGERISKIKISATKEEFKSQVSGNVSWKILHKGKEYEVNSKWLK